jgi:formylglycine-generating enzyme required for sulfatase activity
VAQLRSIGYDVWQDRTSIPPGQDWWQAICEGIETCDVFLFMLSEESVQSFACLAELSYAHALNLPIIPFVLQGEWIYNAGGKYDIDFWDDIPEELEEERTQFLFHEGVSYVDKLKAGIDTLMAKNMPRLPRNATDATNNTTVIYDEAYDFAYRGELDHAKKLFRKLIKHDDPIFGSIALEWVHIIGEYDRIRTMASRKSTRKIARSQWTSYTEQFPKDFMDGVFDPANVEQLLTTKTAATRQAPTVSAPPQQVVSVQTRSKSRSINLMPAPFDWIKIPKNGYWMAKYPVTNAQFRKFIEAGGYDNVDWWTEQGWQYRQNEGWTEPRYWNDRKWNGETQPVVGVSWFESVAFCLWLSDATDEKIMLPTEDQWQYAAQGDDGRTYPWSNEWDNMKCNNSASKSLFSFLKSKPTGHGERTTPVQTYESVGASPFGVVDMAGNVWEWCLTDYSKKTNNFNSIANKRVLRGGSWLNAYEDDIRAGYRGYGSPQVRDNHWGFRVSRS